jgi:hypothetical protein
MIVKFLYAVYIINSNYYPKVTNTITYITVIIIIIIIVIIVISINWTLWDSLHDTLFGSIVIVCYLDQLLLPY